MRLPKVRKSLSGVNILKNGLLMLISFCRAYFSLCVFIDPQSYCLGRAFHVCSLEPLVYPPNRFSCLWAVSTDYHPHCYRHSSIHTYSSYFPAKTSALVPCPIENTVRILKSCIYIRILWPQSIPILFCPKRTHRCTICTHMSYTRT